jgi:hypothetical protein
MNAKTLIAAIGVFGFILLAAVVGAMAFDAQYQRSYDSQTIPGERVVVDVDQQTPVEAAQYTNNFDTSVTVRLDGEQLNGSGEDYTWYPATGNLSWNASSPQVADGDPAAVTYSYDGQPLSVERTRGLRVMLTGALPYLALLFVGLGLLGLFGLLYKRTTSSRTRRGR